METVRLALAFQLGVHLVTVELAGEGGEVIVFTGQEKVYEFSLTDFLVIVISNASLQGLELSLGEVNGDGLHEELNLREGDTAIRVAVEESEQLVDTLAVGLAEELSEFLEFPVEGDLLDEESSHLLLTELIYHLGIGHVLPRTFPLIQHPLYVTVSQS